MHRRVLKTVDDLGEELLKTVLSELGLVHGPRGVVVGRRGGGICGSFSRGGRSGGGGRGGIGEVEIQLAAKVVVGFGILVLHPAPFIAMEINCKHSSAFDDCPPMKKKTANTSMELSTQ